MRERCHAYKRRFSRNPRIFKAGAILAMPRNFCKVGDRDLRSYVGLLICRLENTLLSKNWTSLSAEGNQIAWSSRHPLGNSGAVWRRCADSSMEAAAKFFSASRTAARLEDRT